MALSKKSPKGINQSDWNKIRTIYYLIDNDVIMRDPSMASYTDAPAYSSNKGKGAKEFIKHYHKMYSKLFKRGKAGALLEQYVSKHKGRLEIKAQLQKYQDEGLVELPDFKMAGQTALQQDAASQLDLSGGIFDVLKGTKKDKFQLSAQALSDRVYPLALDQSAATYNKFVQGLPTDFSDIDNPRVQYEALTDYADAMQAGPARVLASNYIADLKFTASSLSKRIANYAGASSGGFSVQARPLPRQLVNQVLDACHKATALINIFASYDANVLTQMLVLPTAGKEAAGTAVSTIRDEISASDDPAKKPYVANVTATSTITQMQEDLDAIDLLVNGRIVGQKYGVFGEIRPKMLQRQQQGLLGLREQIANRSLINLQVIAKQLQEVMIDARSEYKNGGIDQKAYRSIEKTLTTVRKQADSLPTEGSLLNYLNDGDLSRVRDAKYRYDIIRKTLSNISQQLITAKKVSIQLRQKMQEGWTAAQVVAGLQQVYNLVSPVLTMKPQEMTTGFGADLRYPFSKTSQNKPASPLEGSNANAAKASDLAGAKQAARSVQNALAQAKRAGTERALQIYLYLINSADGSTFKKNLKIAWYLSTQKTVKDMSEVVSSQDDFLKKTLNSPEHIQQRILRYYVPSAPYFIQNFMPLNTVGQRLAGASSMVGSKDKIKNHIGADAVSRIPADIVDPRKLLEMLPANIRAMSNDQAKARAQATQEYIASLYSKFTTVVNTQASMMVSGGANYQEMMKSLNRQVDLLSEALKEAKFDNSCRLKELPKHASGLFSVGFLPKMDASGTLKPTLAVIQPDDLLAFQIFKGDTFVQGEARDNEYRMRGSISKTKKSMLQKRGDTTYLARRPITTPWGTTELINWSPLDAADLRNRYFCALYCYDLRIKDLNKRYQMYLNEARNIPTPTEDVGSVLDDFGLVPDAPEPAGGGNRYHGSFNRGGFNRW